MTDATYGIVYGEPDLNFPGVVATGTAEEVLQDLASITQARIDYLCDHGEAENVVQDFARILRIKLVRLSALKDMIYD